MTCPTCARQHQGGDRRLGPFCSLRCQQVDLGRWLAEDYKVPAEGTAPSEGELESALAQHASGFGDGG